MENIFEKYKDKYLDYIKGNKDILKNDICIVG